jgi:hypothetical protein
MKKTEQNYPLPPRWWYTLEEAATELNCTTAYLLHLAQTSRLEILWDIRARELYGKVSEADADILGELYEKDDMAGIDFVALMPFMTLDLLYSINVWQRMYMIHEEELYVLRKGEFIHTNILYFLENDSLEVEDQVCDTPDLKQFPIDNLCITAQEVERLKSGEAMSEAMKQAMIQASSKPLHGNTIKNEAKKSKILCVALACKEQWPNECSIGNLSAWANCICDKWFKFYPAEDPPRDCKTIAKYLAEIPRLPQ